MPKGNPPPLVDDPDLLEPKVALDENPEVKTSNKKPPNPRSTPPTPTIIVNSNVNSNFPTSGNTSNPTNAFPSSNTNNSWPSSSSSNSFNNAAPVNPQIALAQLELDRMLLERQLKDQQEHWAKAYWRPAMGWLYMVICFMDFVGFPLLTIFLPIIFRPFDLTVPYQVWQSLTLANGGLIHLAFGAILGVAAWTRGQEKIVGKN